MAFTGNCGKPGFPPASSIWWNKLTPEQKEQEKLKRAQRKSMRKAMAEVVQAQQAQWVALFNNAALELMKKAIEDKDPQAFTAVYDRLVGKPDTNVDITSNGQTVQAPVIIFESEELPEWKNK